MKISGIKTFIREVREKDDKTKKRYLYVASSLTMIVIIGLWVFYLNVTVPAVQSGAVTTSTTAASPQEQTSTFNYLPTAKPPADQNSFFGTFGNGLEKITSGAASGVSGIWNGIAGWSVNTWDAISGAFQKKNTFEIQSTQTETTTTNNPSPVPPTPLP